MANMQTMKTFLTAHANDSFRHAEELFDAIRNNDCVLHGIPGVVSCHALIWTYGIRSKHLEKYDSEHSRGLCDDVMELNINLQSAVEDAECRIWIFDFQNGSSITFFEELNSGHILGCLKTVSKLAVSKEEWETLWKLK